MYAVQKAIITKLQLIQTTFSGPGRRGNKEKLRPQMTDTSVQQIFSLHFLGGPNLYFGHTTTSLYYEAAFEQDTVF